LFTASWSDRSAWTAVKGTVALRAARGRVAGAGFRDRHRPAVRRPRAPVRSPGPARWPTCWSPKARSPGPGPRRGSGQPGRHTTSAGRSAHAAYSPPGSWPSRSSAPVTPAAAPPPSEHRKRHDQVQRAGTAGCRARPAGKDMIGLLNNLAHGQSLHPSPGGPVFPSRPPALRACLCRPTQHIGRASPTASQSSTPHARAERQANHHLAGLCQLPRMHAAGR